jgi:hypothetical protein
VKFCALACVAVFTAASLSAAAAVWPKHRRDVTVFHGRVALADGSLPQVLVMVERVCNGVAKEGAYADSEGRFNIEFGPEDDSSHCLFRARLPGYRSSTLTPADAHDGNVGTLVLRWRGAKDDAAARSARNKLMTKPGWPLYETGLDLAAKRKINDAEYSLEQSTKVFPWASSNFLALGILRQGEGDAAGAEKSYASAMAAEDSWALPFVYSCQLEASRQEWQQALEHSKKVIALEPKAFPAAWYVSAWASLNLHDLGAAETSAKEGLALDTEREFPELEYVLALALTDKGDKMGAAEHFKAYLELDPKGSRAQAARDQLSQLTSAK